ncbi:hypothetical protein BC830DRAFT_1169486 [Chytriomyces sp. MP71]|nr:hypothetical protein BC830DRAFT_1169486 [Chytriomyces sp. MP71]
MRTFLILILCLCSSGLSAPAGTYVTTVAPQSATNASTTQTSVNVQAADQAASSFANKKGNNNKKGAARQQQRTMTKKAVGNAGAKPGVNGTAVTGTTGNGNQQPPPPSNIPVVNGNTAPYSVLNAPAAAQTATDAFNNFANHVYAVSTSLLGLSSATSANQIMAMANSGYQHEVLEAIEAMKMASFTNNNGGPALQALVQNTPCILNGLKNIVNNPTPATAAQMATSMTVVRDALILPNIMVLGQASGATQVLFLAAVGPLMPNAISVETAGSAKLAQAQSALGCAAAQ